MLGPPIGEFLLPFFSSISLLVVLFRRVFPALAQPCVHVRRCTGHLLSLPTPFFFVSPRRPPAQPAYLIMHVINHRYDDDDDDDCPLSSCPFVRPSAIGLSQPFHSTFCTVLAASHPPISCALVLYSSPLSDPLFFHTYVRRPTYSFSYVADNRSIEPDLVSFVIHTNNLHPPHRHRHRAIRYVMYHVPCTIYVKIYMNSSPILVFVFVSTYPFLYESCYASGLRHGIKRFMGFMITTARNYKTFHYTCTRHN